MGMGGQNSDSSILRLIGNATGAGAARSSAGNRGGYVVGRTLSESVFIPSADQPPAELLMALSFVRPSAVVSDLDTNGQVTLKVEVQNFKASGADPQGPNPFYGDGNPPASVTFAVDSKRSYELVRLGRSVSTYRSDSGAAEPGTAGDARQSQTTAAISQLIFWMNRWLGGPDSGQTGFASLLEIATNESRFNAALKPSVVSAADRLLTEVWTRGDGAGEGADCLVGNDRMLRSLITSAGSKPNCGFWRDVRSQAVVYHYLGKPFYRVPLPDGTDANSGWMCGLNLGSLGLQMIHVTGTAESRGIQLDVQPVDAASGTVVQLVHAAVTPVLWDPYGIFAYNNITYTAD